MAQESSYGISPFEKMKHGDDLPYRNRTQCRWKSEEENGQPGPYNPDIDDGVKVSIVLSRKRVCWQSKR